ncbi:hypothetical protein B1757_14550 [Acidithiobacillus marinus]|uniref:3,4-dihydroxy-2-butanone-4-phosphate synthase n=1 Tax=Acidithiobacillus marinus TaxID=187490 RepID=A0A2I1DI73_9PROT|nr:hypothetical protein [Acidithiobacillus marinus]PKY09567.1 hypothetical protein B1757_14550 [Acidithiobacillus marinus]
MAIDLLVFVWWVRSGFCVRFFTHLQGGVKFPMNPDGSMARGADIARFAALHDLPVITMEDVLGMVNRQCTRN